MNECPVTEEHVPTPFFDESGGGVRCKCGWTEHTRPGTRNRRTMTACWTAFRRHWASTR